MPARFRVPNDGTRNSETWLSFQWRAGPWCLSSCDGPGHRWNRDIQE